MRVKTFVARVAFIFVMVVGLAVIGAHAQQPSAEGATNETRVPLTESATAFDATGRAALAGHLRTTTLTGTPDAPARNARFVIENRSALFYIYVSGTVTFYGGDGVRCGEGVFKLDALAPGESAETDAPGLRLTCAPSAWRVVATNLVTRTGDATMPSNPAAPPTSPPASATPVAESAPPLPPLEIEINGQTLPVQPNNPVDVNIGGRQVRIVVRVAPRD